MYEPLINARWERFAQGVAAGKGKAEAYADAGYTGCAGGGASRLLKRAEVTSRIAQLTEMAADEVGVDIQWWIEKVRENVERCMQGVQHLDEDGEPGGEWAYNASGANKALEILGRHLGAYRADNDQKPAPQGAVIVQYPINSRDK